MLTERQRLILHAIVDDYIRSAEPVGSRSISKRGDIGFSPATIRNEMSDLEDMGFLEQPHTSAGRIPSHKGYRYYVDHLVRAGSLNDAELTMIKMFFAERMMQTEQTIHQAASILSNLTNYTAIVLGPEMYNTTLKHIQLVPLSGSTAVAIIVTSTGHVENRMVSIPEDLEMSDLEKLVNILNARLSGVPLLYVKSRLYSEIAQELSRHVSRYEELIRVVEDALDQDQEDRVFLSGTTNMLNQPEFRDVEKVKLIFDLFDATDKLTRIFTDVSSGIQVRIGSENAEEAINGCSLVTATYSIGDEHLGTLGILGPTRMDYGRVIGLLDYLSKDLALVLSRWHK